MASKGLKIDTDEVEDKFTPTFAEDKKPEADDDAKAKPEAEATKLTLRKLAKFKGQ